MASGDFDIVKRHGPLWPDVSNPIAREIIGAAYDCKPYSDLNPPSLVAEEMYRFPQYNKYRRQLDQGPRSGKVQQQLESSGLSSLLAQGQSALPDILPGLPWYVRLSEQRFRPKSFRELTIPVARFLDWYLDPESSPARSQYVRSCRREKLAQSVIILLNMIGAVLLPVKLLQILSFSVAGFNAIQIAYDLFFRDPNSIPLQAEVSKVHTNEFYYYLREQLSDKPD